MEHAVLEAAESYIREVFRSDFGGHDASHTLRVCRTACRLAQAEGGDLFIVQLAALLHDVDDRKLSPDTCADKARAAVFMRAQGLGREVIERVCTIIGEVAFAGRDSVVPSSMEGKCVQDADRLDALGAIGAARAFAYGGSHNRVMHDPEIKPCPDMGGEAYRRHVSTTVNHFYEKLFLLEGMMNTGTARALAAHRTRYMRGFLEEFLAEWDGER